MEETVAEKRELKKGVESAPKRGVSRSVKSGRKETVNDVNIL